MKIGASFWTLITVAAVLIASLRIVSTYKALSATTDEPAHLAAGLEYLATGAYTYEDQHPPLARVVGAMWLRFAGAPFGHDPDMYIEGYRLLGYQGRYRRNLFYSRLAMLPFFWIAASVVFLWTLRIATPRAAAFAVILLTTIPAILGHAGLVTTDAAVAALTWAALFAAVEFARKPSLLSCLVFSVCLSLAILSKFSALLFFPVAATVIAICRYKHLRLRSVARYLPRMVLTSGLIVWGSYSFSLGRVSYLGMTLPAPAFFSGLRSVWLQSQSGHASFLLGKVSQTGFWYYYPVVIFFKTPIGVMALILWGLWRPDCRRYLFLLLTATAIVLVSIPTHINIGVRHVLLIYLPVATFAGIACDRILSDRRSLATGCMAAAVLWCVLSVALFHPDYISYVNEFAGKHPEDILADSDLDWEQGYGRLDKRLRELGVQHFTFQPNTTGYLISGNRFLPYRYMPPGPVPPHGWSAIAITPWRVSGQPEWPDQFKPREVVGHSILLYWFP